LQEGANFDALRGEEQLLLRNPVNPEDRGWLCNLRSCPVVSRPRQRRYRGAPAGILDNGANPRLVMTATPRTDNLVEQVAAALTERQHLLPTGLAARDVATRIAQCYHDLADGTSGFWVARPRWAAAEGRPTGRALYEVLRADGHVGVWDALTLDEGELIADALTKLSL
jgi:hypothetical protein